MRIFWIFLIATISVARAQTPEENISITASDTLSPGKNFPVNIIIPNADPELNIETILPANWKTISTGIYPIESTNDVRFFYLFSPSKKIESGNYTLGFKIFSSAGEVYKSINVSLAAERDVRVSKLKSPQYILEGDTLHTSFLIENLGNTTEKIVLSSSNSSIYGADTLIVKPKELTEVSVYRPIPKTNQNTWEASTDLKITNELGIAQVAYTSTNVLSRSLKKADQYLRLPVEAGTGLFFYNAGQGPVLAFQGILAGKGFLDSKEKHYVNFDLRGPNQIMFPAIGGFDNYSLYYKNKSGVEASLGDFTNQVSTLLEFSRYGRGAKIQMQKNQFDFNLFFQNARFFPYQKNSFGAQVNYVAKNDIKLGFNLMNKQTFSMNEWIAPTLASVTASWESEMVQVETELAQSISKQGNSLGFNNQANARIGKLSGYSNIILSGKTFFGFFNNSRQFNHGVNYAINPKMSVGINSNISRVNPSLDLNLFTISPYFRGLMATYTYRPSLRHTILFNLNSNEREDRQPVSQFHYKESFINSNYSFDSPKFRFESQVRLSKAQNLLLETESSARLGYDYLVMPSVQALKGFWVGGYFQNQRTNKFSTDNSLENLFYYGFNISGNVRNKLVFNFTYRNNFAPDEFFQKRSFLDANLNWDFRTSRIEFRASQSFLPGITATNQSTTFFSLNFVKKFGVPVAKNRNIGHVSGKLKAYNGINIANQQIRLGQFVSVTDNAGNFYFSNLTPGRYHLSLDQSSRQEGVTTKGDILNEINLVADSTINMEIELVKTGGVEGFIDFQISDKFIELKQKGELPEALIKLEMGNSTFMTHSNQKGEFTIKDIKPGEYTLVVSLLNFKENLVVLDSKRTITIKSGDLSSERFLVRTIERKVKFSTQEFNLTSNK